MLKNSRGVSNIGCLLTLAIIVCGFYVGYKFALVQWDIESFKEEMTELTRFWANEHRIDSTAAIAGDVVRRAEKYGFNLETNDVTVNTEGAAITITASWEEPIIFPGGYVYKRAVTITRSIKKAGY